MFQRKYLLFLATLIVIALAWTGGWFWIADKLRADIEAFADAQRADGVVLDWMDLRVSGYPIRFDTTFQSPSASWPTPERDIAWTGADTAIRPFVEGPGVVSFRAPGEHLITVSEAGLNLQLVADADDLQGRLSFDNNGDVTGLRGRAAPLALTIDDGPAVQLAAAAFDWERRNGKTPSDDIHPDGIGDSLSLILDQIDLAQLPLGPGVTQTLGTTIEKFAGQIDLRGPLEPESISSENLARWRDAGGTLEVESLTLDWGPLRIAGDGTLTVDQALQPVGAFAARVSGLDLLLDLLEERGQIRSQQAAIARIALAVLTRRPADGGPPEASVPVTIQNQVLSIGPVPLIKLETAVWD